MDECCGYDDAGAKVFGNEEGPFWDAYSSMSTRVDGESGTCIGQWSNGERAGGWPLRVPNVEPINITKMAETRRPIRPL